MRKRRMMRKARKSREMEKHKHKDSRPSKTVIMAYPFPAAQLGIWLALDDLHSGGLGLYGWNMTAQAGSRIIRSWTAWQRLKVK